MAKALASQSALGAYRKLLRTVATSKSFAVLANRAKERKNERARERERERERMLGSTTIVRITYEPTVCLHLTFFFMSSNSIQGR